jgi:hypothetical protein
MKKIVLSLAGVMAAVAFAPEASAVPVFARQTGMACTACHFQHFPLLNGFGRAFKNGGFTMVGSQAKVEGEHLDIPDRLNMGVLTSSFYQDESGSNGHWGVPAFGGELSIFYGGRISEFAGFLSELGAMGTAGTGAAKEAILFPVGDARVGAVVYSGGQGAAYGFETLNTGAADTHKMMGNAGPNKQHVAAAYAGSYLGTRTDATGANIVANNSMGFVSIGRFAPALPADATANSLPLTYARVAATLDIAGWDAGFGVQKFSGDTVTLDGGKTIYDATVIDAQMQGEIAGMETGFYVTYGTAPADANGNALAAGWSTLMKTKTAAERAVAQQNLKATSLNIATSVELIPHIATVQLATRMATLSDTVAAKDTTDNAVMVGFTYELAQNFELAYNYTTQSGSAWDGLTAPVGKTASTFLVEVLF